MCLCDTPALEARSSWLNPVDPRHRLSCWPKLGAVVVMPPSYRERRGSLITSRVIVTITYVRRGWRDIKRKET